MSIGSGYNVVYDQTFDSKGYTNENSLAAARLTEPDYINKVLTHLQGRESDMFPLTFLTEGQEGGVRPVEIEDIQYRWRVIGKLDKADEVVGSSYTAASTPGAGGAMIKVTFKTNYLKKQHTIVGSDGSQCRVVANPEPTTGGWLYTLELLDTNKSNYVDPYLLQSGAMWAMEGPGTVSESLSYGNESNITAPGEVKNQISILRKSYHIGGNVGSRTVGVQFPAKGGGTTTLWMPFEEWRHELMWKKHCEEHYWFSKYNRNASGEIMNTDQETGLKIPHGGGVVDQIPNTDTYSRLTANKLDNTVLSVMYGRQDEWSPKEVILYTGIGGAREFDRALKEEVSGLSQITGDKFVRGEGYNLTYGGYFKAYETNEGLRIIVKKLNILDHGGRAKVAPKHPEYTNMPLTSFDMYFVDQTSYEGVPNVRMATQKNRGLIRGVEQGMALLKGSSYGDYSGNSKDLQLATSQDKTSIHYLAAKGIAINNNSHCFALNIDRSIGV